MFITAWSWIPDGEIIKGGKANNYAKIDTVEWKKKKVRADRRTSAVPKRHSGQMVSILSSRLIAVGAKQPALVRALFHCAFKGLKCGTPTRRCGFSSGDPRRRCTSLRGRTLKFSFHKNVIENMQRPSVLCHFSAGFI